MEYRSIRKNLACVVIIFCSLLYSCEAGDSKILNAAKANATAIDPDVTVVVDKGVMTLTGMVRDEPTREALEKIP